MLYIPIDILGRDPLFSACQRNRATPMKTDISTFCEACSQVLSPLPESLTAATDELFRARGDSLNRSLASLNDLRARLRSLTDKLATQQAYLLIFGPLKSGKSTLVNALSGAYVSEVTSLPGYPCLVYVQDSPEPRFALTRYNGRESTFADAGVLKEVIADSHIALAQQIQQAENAGLPFEPGTNFPEAIRRVDVKVPVPSLAQSKTALVDTPGLYSRMNFGYDVLTREFRNSAACAVFVVKTDNLYLEQVFAEFDQLLDLFSRIFLVINVDSSKRDLQADGTLALSAESREPEKVVEAFTTLSMSGPLRQAYEENRLRIHALDLLNAASSVLTKQAKTSENQRFDRFVGDLTDYLNSSEYTVEFMRDSLRQAGSLAEEVVAICGEGELRQVRDRQEELTLELRSLEERLGATGRLLKVDWAVTFRKFREDAVSEIGTRVQTTLAQIAEELPEALGNWMQRDDGLKDLEERHWDPLLLHAAIQIATETRARLFESARTAFGGTQPSSMSIDDLHRIRVVLPEVATAALPRLAEEDAVDPYMVTIEPDLIPVAKTLGDWFMFRRVSTVRHQLFGDDLRQRIAPEVKAKRLSARSREALLQTVGEGVKLKFAILPVAYANRLIDAYVEKFCAELLETLRRRREYLDERRSKLQAEFDANERLATLMRQLEETATRAIGELDWLGQTENLLSPAPPANFSAAEMGEPVRQASAA
jgi:GTPase SAR1 family protein